MTKFEKETSEALAALREQNKSIFRTLDEMKSFVQGNGHKGLLTRVALLEDQQTPTNKDLADRISAIEQRHEISDRKNKRQFEWYAIAASCIGSVWSIVTGLLK